MAEMVKEVHSLYGIRYCHLVYYEDVIVKAHVHVYTGCIIIIIITFYSILIITLKKRYYLLCLMTDLSERGKCSVYCYLQLD